MSKDNPIWGVDISSFQGGIDLEQVAREGYEFCVVKASEGPYGDGTFFLNPLYGPQIDSAQRAGLLTGAYHFLVETPAAAQVDLFLNTVAEVSGKPVGDVSGMLVMVDYEAYPEPFQFLSPTMATLEAFVTELRNRIGVHPILVYAGQGYWNEPPPNGSIRHLDVMTWDAFYPLHPQAGFGSALYEQVKHLGWGERWGNQEPMFWQFSSNGMVAGMQIDVNAFRSTRQQLFDLADAGPAPEVQPKPAPVEVPLAPPSFVELAVQPGSFMNRHPTRYEWREDVEDQIRRISAAFPELTIGSINTYVDHPETFGRDLDSFDVWGPGMRNDPVGFDLGGRVFDFIFNDPNPPLIDWIIWRRAIWTSASGIFEAFGVDDFSFHDDHIHVTFQ
jgi:GH25 family lysozyme M1 (1,4-beta-N-acetylmuramidase)